MTLKRREFTSTTEKLPSDELKRWEERDYGILENSDASTYLKRLLVARATVRPRFFFGGLDCCLCETARGGGIRFI